MKVVLQTVLSLSTIMSAAVVHLGRKKKCSTLQFCLLRQYVPYLFYSKSEEALC